MYKIQLCITTRNGFIAVLPSRVCGFLNQQKFVRDQTRNLGKALMGTLLQQQVVKSNMFPCILPEEGKVVSYIRCGYGYVQELGQRGGINCSPTLSVVCAQVMCFYSRYPAPNSSEVAAGIFGLSLFCL